MSQHEQTFVVLPFSDVTDELLSLDCVQEKPGGLLRHTTEGPDEVFLHFLGPIHDELSSYPSFSHEEFAVELKTDKWCAKDGD